MLISDVYVETDLCVAQACDASVKRREDTFS